MAQRHRAGVGSKNHNAKLTEELVQQARLVVWMRKGLPTIKAMAVEWGVNEDVLARAVKGESWRHV